MSATTIFMACSTALRAGLDDVVSERLRDAPEPVGNARRDSDYIAVCQVPLVASGGAGAAEHFTDVFQTACVDAALAASALFLVPGVPMLNGTADLLTTHYLNGLVKLAMSAVIVASAAVGLTVAVALAGVLA